MYRKSIRTKRLEAKRKRCAAMRAAKGRDGVAYLSTTLFNFRINQQLGE